MSRPKSVAANAVAPTARGRLHSSTVRTPTILALDTADADVYTSECFGPVSYLIATDSTDASIDLFRDTVTDHGAMTASVYSTDEKVLDATERAAIDAGVALSMNLTGGVFVNQSAAFSDFHGTGANPAANASLTDGAFVAGDGLTWRTDRCPSRTAGPPDGRWQPR